MNQRVPRVRKLLFILPVTIFVLLFLFILIAGCFRLWLYHSGPLERVGETWVSEDGRITIVVLNNHKGKGKLRTNDLVLEFNVVQSSLESTLSITYPGTNIVFPGVEAASEEWTFDRKSEDEYVVTVDYSYTGYFSVGETITLYRIESSGKTS